MRPCLSRAQPAPGHFTSQRHPPCEALTMPATSPPSASKRIPWLRAHGSCLCPSRARQHRADASPKHPACDDLTMCPGAWIAPKTELPRSALAPWNETPIGHQAIDLYATAQEPILPLLHHCCGMAQCFTSSYEKTPHKLTHLPDPRSSEKPRWLWWSKLRSERFGFLLPPSDKCRAKRL